MFDSVQHCRRIRSHFRSGVSENGDASAPAPVVDRDLHPYPIQAFLNAIHLDDVAISSKWSSDRITRHSENALLRATQAGSLLRVQHRRIGRSRLPADSACPGRAIDPHQIRADHAAFSGFRSTFPYHESRNSGHFLDASDTSIGGGVAFCSGMAPPPAASCVAGAFTDACGLANLTPEEEPESPAEVRSQRKRCLPSVDE